MVIYPIFWEIKGKNDGGITMTTKLEEVTDLLATKGIEARQEQTDGTTTLSWETGRCSYAIQFDTTGRPWKAEILQGGAVFGMRRLVPFFDPGYERGRWYKSGPLGCTSRFVTMEKWLGTQVFS